jgi:hypothetical protein
MFSFYLSEHRPSSIPIQDGAISSKKKMAIFEELIDVLDFDV